MWDVINKVLDLLEKRESFVLATVVGVRGSAPRDSGAHMVVQGEGNIYGTIGGGPLESLVIEESKEVLIDKSKRLLTVNLVAEKNQVDMTCGGQVDLLINNIDADQVFNLELYQSIKDCLDKGQRAWLVTSLKPGYNISLVKQDADCIGDIIVDSHTLLQRIKSIISTTVLSDLHLLVEPISDAGTAYVFGAGHIGVSLVPLLKMVGFRTVIIDDRSDYANTERFPDADYIISADMGEVFYQLEVDNRSYVVIITRGHAHDKEVLAQALRKPAAYIGMIGSKRKRETIYNSLLEEGYSRDDLERVHSPIGLPIQAESPEEIAVSITAEMIQVRAGLGSGKSSKCPER